MSFPYISGSGNITQLILQLRKAFPATITSETIKKLGIAPNNESYLINAIQFIGLIDSAGKKTNEGTKVFSVHKDEDFAKSFEQLIKKAYSGIFELHGEAAWTLGDDDLVTFFRSSDSTSDIIGKRQSSAFKAFAALAGHSDATAKVAKPRTIVGAKKGENKLQKGKEFIQSKQKESQPKNPFVAPTSAVGLTVRVEINLPADGSKETYDNIFKSIKANLLNG